MNRILVLFLCLCMVLPNPLVLADVLAPSSATRSPTQEEEYDAAQDYLNTVKQLRDRKNRNESARAPLLQKLRDDLEILLRIPELGVVSVNDLVLLLRRDNPESPWQAFGRLHVPESTDLPHAIATFRPAYAAINAQEEFAYRYALEKPETKIFVSKGKVSGRSEFPDYLQWSHVMLSSAQQASHIIAGEIAHAVERFQLRCEKLLFESRGKQGPDAKQMISIAEDLLGVFERLNPDMNRDVYVRDYALRSDIEPHETELYLATAQKVYGAYSEKLQPLRDFVEMLKDREGGKKVKHPAKTLSSVISQLINIVKGKYSLAEAFQFHGKAMVINTDSGESRVVVTFGEALVRIESPPFGRTQRLPTYPANVSTKSSPSDIWQFLAAVFLFFYSPHAVRAEGFDVSTWMERFTGVPWFEAVVSFLGIATVGVVLITSRKEIGNFFSWVIGGMNRVSLPKEWGLPSQGRLLDARLALLLDKRVGEEKQIKLGFIARHEIRTAKDAAKVAKRLGGFSDAQIEALIAAGFSHDAWKGQSEVVEAILSPMEFTPEQKRQKLEGFADLSEKILMEAAGENNRLRVSDAERLLVRHHRAPSELLGEPEMGSLEKKIDMLKLSTILYVVNRLDTITDPSYPWSPKIPPGEVLGYIETKILQPVKDEVKRALEAGVGAGPNRWNRDVAADTVLHYGQFCNRLADTVTQVFNERKEEINKRLEGKKVEEQVGILIPYGSTPEHPQPFHVEDLIAKIGGVKPPPELEPRVRRAVDALEASGEVVKLHGGRYVDKKMLERLQQLGLVKDFWIGEKMDDDKQLQPQKDLIAEMDVTKMLQSKEAYEIWLAEDGARKMYYAAELAQKMEQRGELRPFRMSSDETIYVSTSVHNAMIEEGLLFPFYRLKDDHLVREFVHKDHQKFLMDSGGRCIEVVTGASTGRANAQKGWVYTTEFSGCVEKGLIVGVQPMIPKPKSGLKAPLEHTSWALASALDDLDRAGWGHYALMNGNRADSKGEKVFIHRDGLILKEYRRGARLYRVQQLMALYEDTDARKTMESVLKMIMRDPSAKGERQRKQLLSLLMATGPKRNREEMQVLRKAFQTLNKPERIRETVSGSTVKEISRIVDSEMQKQAMNIVLPILGASLGTPRAMKSWLAIAKPYFGEDWIENTLKDAGVRYGKSLASQNLIAAAYEVARRTYEDLDSELGGYAVDEILMVATGIAAPVETRVPAEYVAACLLLLSVPGKPSPEIPKEIEDVTNAARRLRKIGRHLPPKISRRMYQDNFINMILKASGSVPALLIYLAYQMQYLKMAQEHGGMDFERQNALRVRVAAELAHRVGLDNLAQRIRGRLSSKTTAHEKKERAAGLESVLGINDHDFLFYVELLRENLQHEIQRAGIAADVTVSPMDLSYLKGLLAMGRLHSADLNKIPGLVTFRIVVRHEEDFAKIEKLPQIRRLLQKNPMSSGVLGDAAQCGMAPVEKTVFDLWLKRKGAKGDKVLEAHKKRFDRVNNHIAKKQYPVSFAPIELIVQTKAMYSADLTGMRLSSLYGHDLTWNPLDVAGPARDVPDKTDQTEAALQDLLQGHRSADFEFVRFAPPVPQQSSKPNVEWVYAVPKRSSDPHDTRPTVKDVLMEREYKDLGRLEKGELSLEGRPVKTGDERVATGDLLEVTGQRRSEQLPSPISIELLNKYVPLEIQAMMRVSRLKKIDRTLSEIPGCKLRIRLEEEMPLEGVAKDTVFVSLKEISDLLKPDFEKWGIHAEDPLAEYCLAMYMGKRKAEDLVSALLFRCGERMLKEEGLNIAVGKVQEKLPALLRLHFSGMYTSTSLTPAEELEELVRLVGSGRLETPLLLAAMESPGEAELKEIGLSKQDTQTLHALAKLLPEKYRASSESVIWNKLALYLTLGIIHIGRVQSVVALQAKAQESVKGLEGGTKKPQEAVAQEPKTLGVVLVGQGVVLQEEEVYPDKDGMQKQLINAALSMRNSLGVPDDTIVIYRIVDGDSAPDVNVNPEKPKDIDVRISKASIQNTMLLKSTLRSIHWYALILREKLLDAFDPVLHEVLARALSILAQILDEWKKGTLDLEIDIYGKAESRLPPEKGYLKDLLTRARDRRVVDKRLIEEIISFICKRNAGLKKPETLERFSKEGLNILSNPEFLGTVLPQLLGVRDDRWPYPTLASYRDHVDASLWDERIKDSVAAMDSANHAFATMVDWMEHKIISAQEKVGELLKEGEDRVRGPERAGLRGQLAAVVEKLADQTDALRNIENPLGLQFAEEGVDARVFDADKIKSTAAIPAGISEEELSIRRGAVQAPAEMVYPFVENLVHQVNGLDAAEQKSAGEGRRALSRIQKTIRRLKEQLRNVAGSDEDLNRDFVVHHGAIGFPNLLNHGDVSVPGGGLHVEHIADRYANRIRQEPEDKDVEQELAVYLGRHPTEALSILREMLEQVEPDSLEPVAVKLLASALGFSTEPGPWADAYARDRKQRSADSQKAAMETLYAVLDMLWKMDKKVFAKTMRDAFIPQLDVERKSSWIGIEEALDKRGQRTHDWADLLRHFTEEQWKIYLDGFDINSVITKVQEMKDKLEETRERAKRLEEARAEAAAAGVRKPFYQSDKEFKWPPSVVTLEKLLEDRKISKAEAIEIIDAMRRRAIAYVDTIALSPGDVMEKRAAWMPLATALIALTQKVNAIPSEGLNGKAQELERQYRTKLMEAFERLIERWVQMDGPLTDPEIFALKSLLETPDLPKNVFQSIVLQERFTPVVRKMLEEMAKRDPVRATKFVEHVLTMPHPGPTQIFGPLAGLPPERIVEVLQAVEAIPKTPTKPVWVGDQADQENVVGRAA